MALNVVAIMGRLTAEPELKTTQSGVSVCSFRIAVDRNRADANGQRQADFFEVVAWRGTADFVCKYFQKGGLIAIDGQLQSRQYQDKNGNNRTAIEIVASGVNFCGGKKENSAPSFEQQTKEFEHPAPTQRNAPPSMAGGSGDDFAMLNETDDLPF